MFIKAHQSAYMLAHLKHTENGLTVCEYVSDIRNVASPLLTKFVASPLPASNPQCTGAIFTVKSMDFSNKMNF